MNFDAIASWLTHANWVFLALWIAFLAAAVRASFPEHSSSPKNLQSGSQR